MAPSEREADMSGGGAATGHGNEEIFETLEVTVDGAIGRLMLARPERLNALSRTMLRELAEAARWFDGHRHLKIVVVSGAGRSFCDGFDLDNFATR
ncbi:MAG: enoyl-CoA hydratase/isomerase family protein, partial [Actinomycetota bacterium]